MIKKEIIKNFTDDEIAQIARLHINNIKSGFLSSLGEDFLKLIYFSIQKKGVLIGLRSDNSVIGFVSGVEDINAVYYEFIKKNFFKAFFFILPKMISFNVIKKVVEIALYPLQKKIDKIELPKAELLSIVMEPDQRGTGGAEVLYKELVKDFQGKNIEKFKIIVGAKLIGAQKFYSKMGALQLDSINIHKGEKSWVYLQQIA
ncbi:MAG: GNAT family N-acetyltransferase [Bacteroidota bacterium]|nr:GNAT family N-acetyltransferase [Bacteroidota bacterium]